VGVPVLQVTLYAFRTKLSLIDGKFLPGLEADDLVLPDLELDAALHAAETAVRFHELVRFSIVPSARGRVGGSRAEQLNVARFRYCSIAHWNLRFAISG